MVSFVVNRVLVVLIEGYLVAEVAAQAPNEPPLLTLLLVVLDGVQEVEVGLHGLLVRCLLGGEVEPRGREGDVEEIADEGAVLEQEDAVGVRLALEEVADVVAGEEEEVLEGGLADGGVRHAVELHQYQQVPHPVLAGPVVPLHQRGQLLCPPHLPELLRPLLLLHLAVQHPELAQQRQVLLQQPVERGQVVPQALAEKELEVFLEIGFDLVPSDILVAVNQVQRNDLDVGELEHKGAFGSKKGRPLPHPLRKKLGGLQDLRGLGSSVQLSIRRGGVVELELVVALGLEGGGVGAGAARTRGLAVGNSGERLLRGSLELAVEEQPAERIREVRRLLGGVDQRKEVHKFISDYSHPPHRAKQYDNPAALPTAQEPLPRYIQLARTIAKASAPQVRRGRPAGHAARSQLGGLQGRAGWRQTGVNLLIDNIDSLFDDRDRPQVQQRGHGLLQPLPALWHQLLEHALRVLPAQRLARLLPQDRLPEQLRARVHAHLLQRLRRPRPRRRHPRRQQAGRRAAGAGQPGPPVIPTRPYHRPSVQTVHPQRPNRPRYESQTQRLMFLAIRLMEGVGRESVQAAGFHVSFSASPFSVLLRSCEDSVCARSRGFTYSGQRPIGSPCPRRASLNLVSCEARLVAAKWCGFFWLRRRWARSSRPYCARSFVKLPSPWLIDLNMFSWMTLLRQSSFSCRSASCGRLYSSRRCGSGLQSLPSTREVGFVSTFAGSVFTRPFSSLRALFGAPCFSSRCGQGALVVHGLAAAGGLEVLLVHGRPAVHAVVVLQLHAQLVLVGVLLVDALRHLDERLLPHTRPARPAQQVPRRRLRFPVLPSAPYVAPEIRCLPRYCESSPRPSGGGWLNSPNLRRLAASSASASMLYLSYFILNFIRDQPIAKPIRSGVCFQTALSKPLSTLFCGIYSTPF